MAVLKYLAVLFLKALLALASVMLGAEGLRLVSAMATTKISRLPGLAVLADFEEFERIDGAFIVAIVLTATQFWALTDLFGNLLMPDEEEEVGIGRTGHLMATSITVIGLAIIDGYLFYNGVAESRWGESDFSGSAAAMAAGFEFLVGVVALMSVVMKQRIGNFGG